VLTEGQAGRLIIERFEITSEPMRKVFVDDFQRLHRSAALGIEFRQLGRHLGRRAPPQPA